MFRTTCYRDLCLLFTAERDGNWFDVSAAIRTHFSVLRVVFFTSRTNHFCTSQNIFSFLFSYRTTPARSPSGKRSTTPTGGVAQAKPEAGERHGNTFTGWLACSDASPPAGAFPRSASQRVKCTPCQVQIFKCKSVH